MTHLVRGGLSRYRNSSLRTARISCSCFSSSVGTGVGCRDLTRLGTTGARRGDGSDAEDVEGVFDSERDAEGNDTMHR